MVKLASITSFALLALPAAWAAPSAELEVRHNQRECISDWEGKQLVDKFKSLFEKIDEKVAKQILTKDYTVESASLNFLFGKQGGTTSTGRDEFIQSTKAQQASEPPGRKVTILDAAYVCDKIWFRWTDNTPPVPLGSLFGFDELILTKKEGGWKIKTDYTEFNNAIVLYDAGLFPCNASNTPTPGT